MKKIIYFAFTISLFIFSGCMRDKCTCGSNGIPFDSKKWKENCGEMRQCMARTLIKTLKQEEYTKEQVIILLGQEDKDELLKYCKSDTTLYYHCPMPYDIGVSDREALILEFKNGRFYNHCFYQCEQYRCKN